MAGKLHLVSLGCTKNLIDSEVMLARLKSLEMTQEPGEADVIVVNTCGFIDAAKEESINTILGLHEQRKEGSLLVMAGCLSQRYQEELKGELPEVDIFTGVGDYARIDALIAGKMSEFTDQVFLQTEEERVVTGSNFHAYIKIAEGCNQSCSFCAIPSFKGRLHSRSLESIVKEVKRLVSQGFFDFSFIAQDTSSYGRDMGLKQGLIDLIGAIEQIDGVKRARILYLYPSTTSPELIAKIANSKVFAPYFDIPLQHATENMFKTMKRGLGAQETLKLVEQMRAVPNSWLRSAFIVGHPGESEADFEALCTLIESGLFDMISLFGFSDEEGTTAHDMAQKVDAKTIKTRLKKAEKLAKSARKKRLKKLIGQTVPVVIQGESDEHEFLIAAKHLDWAPEIDPVILINDSEVEGLKPGQIGQAEITQSTDEALIARFIG
ncbi:MAG: 30S ribosomal protein S12 methylthiotransferase RimO [Campylobacterales bacterium]